MTDYYFDLAGLRTLLRTPYAITVSENLQPFLQKAHSSVHVTITLETKDTLPAKAAEGVWHGFEYYDRHRDTSRIFHCHAPGAEGFAVTQFLQDGNVTITVLPQYVSYFTGRIGIFNRIGLENLLLQHQGLLLHASLIKYKDKTIAFAGPSGVGKSTQADLWATHMGAEILNGDRAALRNVQNWTAYGYPCAGTSGIYKNDAGPLAGIVILGQSPENRLRKLTPPEAFRLLSPEITVHRWDKAFVETATELCAQLVEQIPVYYLECRPDQEAALLVQKGLML